MSATYDNDLITEGISASVSRDNIRIEFPQGYWTRPIDRRLLVDGSEAWRFGIDSLCDAIKAELYWLFEHGGEPRAVGCYKAVRDDDPRAVNPKETV